MDIGTQKRVIIVEREQSAPTQAKRTVHPRHERRRAEAEARPDAGER